MKKEMRKIVLMLLLVLGFSVLGMAIIWIPEEMWDKGQTICEHGFFSPDGESSIIEGVPAISGECICWPGYEGPRCQFRKDDN